MPINESTIFSPEYFIGNPSNRLLILAEGFEKRSLSLCECINTGSSVFADCILLDYKHHTNTRVAELKAMLQTLVENEPIEIPYDRFNPSQFEQNLAGLVRTFPRMDHFDEIFIDISVMSKLLILILINIFSKIEKPIKIIYVEPLNYSPSESEFFEAKRTDIQSFNLPSYGVNQVVRTPMLSSSIMQNYPSLLVAFTSFNGQLVRALISDLSPHKLILGVSDPPTHKWRRNAANEIHQDIFDLYRTSNDDITFGDSNNHVCTLDPHSAFTFLSKIYSKYCFFNRIIIAPTGSKMQAVGCALFKLCCPDVHIEYPTPEGYFTTQYSSPEIRGIHMLDLGIISREIPSLQENYNLNG